jgi:hypothetical protein
MDHPDVAWLVTEGAIIIRRVVHFYGFRADIRVFFASLSGAWIHSRLAQATNTALLSIAEEPVIAVSIDGTIGCHTHTIAFITDLSRARIRSRLAVIQ